VKIGEVVAVIEAGGESAKVTESKSAAVEAPKEEKAPKAEKKGKPASVEAPVAAASTPPTAPAAPVPAALPSIRSAISAANAALGVPAESAAIVSEGRFTRKRMTPLRPHLMSAI
jgi:pyruvate/2-oxoglutarate dehydrogenase complex dihydrolipoamide acyltransferase (E2) component